MIDQERINQQLNKQQSAPPITPIKIATVRLISDFIVVLVTAFFVSDVLDLVAGRFILMGTAIIFGSTLIGYFIMRRGNEILGMGFLIYGLIIGLTTVSVFAANMGVFTLVTLVMINALSVSYSIPQRRVIEAISSSLIFGAASVIFDLNYNDAAFRLPTPDLLIDIVWVIIIVLIIIFLYFIAKQFSTFSFRAKIIAAFSIITVFSLIVLGFLNTRSVNRVLTEEANQALYNAASQTAVTLSQFINYNMQTIRTEAQLPNLVQYAASSDIERENMAATTTETLNILMQKNENIASYALLDLQGNVLIDTDETNIGMNEANLDTFNLAIQNGGPSMSNVEMAPINGAPSLYFSAPIIENGNIIVGVLRARYHADILQTIIETSNGRGGSNSFAVLFDENHIHLAHGTAPETIFTSVVPLDDTTFEYLKQTRRLPNQTKEETFLDLPDLDIYLQQSQNSESGVVYFDATDIATGNEVNRVVVINLENPSWLLAFFQPKDIFLEPVEQLQNNTIFFSLLSGFGTVFFAVVLSQILALPILKLNEGAQEISRGNLDTRVDIGTDDEIGTLANSFNNMASQLENMVGSLEQQVKDRTKTIESKTIQLQAATEVARDATSELALEDMLNRASALIQDRFGFYHVGIYLKDTQGENLILTASQDKPGAEMIANGYRYKIDVESNPGFVCILGESKRASIDSPDAPLQYNTMLPQSQAQLVLPLNLANQTIGVIDIHSTNPNDFSEEDTQIYQTIADQLAIAIQKARFNQEVQETLNELEAAYGTFTEKSWQSFIQGKERSLGYRFRNMKTEPVYQTPALVKAAWDSGTAVEDLSTPPDKLENGSRSLAIPIKIRGEVISVLNLEFEGEQVPPGVNNLVTEIADRLSLIIENARLIETARMQVNREQLASHITNTIRQSLDMDVVLRTAVQEIGEALGLPEVEIRLGSEDQQIITESPSPNGNGNVKPTE